MKKALVTSTSAVIFALIACVFDHISAVYTVGMYASTACCSITDPDGKKGRNS